jgi:hypothetical protein
MNELVVTDRRGKDVLELMAERYALSLEDFEKTVRATCFPADPPATREEFVAGMQIAHRLDLNPLLKEVHFARQRGGGVVAIIGADGWYTLANRHPMYNGCQFTAEFGERQVEKNGQTVTVTEPFAVTCRIHRKDREYPTEVTEYYGECFRANSSAWQLTPMRLLRHRAFGQCCRTAFGFAGVMEYDEFLRWQEQVAENEAAERRVLESPVKYEDDPPPQKPDAAPHVTAVVDKLTPPAPPPDNGKKPKARKKAKEPEPEDDPLVDQDAYVALLEESMVVCRDMENLLEVWSDYQDMKNRLSLENQRRADDLHTKHTNRLEGTKG